MHAENSIAFTSCWSKLWFQEYCRGWLVSKGWSLTKENLLLLSLDLLRVAFKDWVKTISPHFFIIIILDFLQSPTWVVSYLTTTNLERGCFIYFFVCVYSCLFKENKELFLYLGFVSILICVWFSDFWRDWQIPHDWHNLRLGYLQLYHYCLTIPISIV